MYWFPVLVLVAVAITDAQAQATANVGVAPELRECYTNATLSNRNNLPPSTIQVLIDIIRKIEDHPDVNVDLRMLATLILHTYRQDGIQYYQRSNTGVSQSPLVIPYSPSFHSFHRHRLVLRLIPNNLQTLSNTTLPSSLKCALHHMLSTTVDARVRGDENTCGQLSQYRALRTSRSVRTVPEDVEILDLKALGANQNGQIRQNNPNDDVESTSFGADKSARLLVGESTCPILTGVVHTRWGAISAGNLIAGIAAGAEMQRVSVTDLTKGIELNYQNVPATLTTIYPATLSGDLAEAVLIQGTRGSTSISIGSSGNWNSTQANRYFMLSSRDNLQMTDPEIRGGIDGFLLGSSLTSTLGTFSSLKLSQLLDMYYTPRTGVFNSVLRACNRRTASQQSIVGTNLESETQAFAAALDTVLPLEGTLTDGLQILTNSAVTNFQTYTNNNLNDLNCAITETTTNDIRLKTNLYIVLDASWQYQTIYPAISYLLDSIEVGKFGSSITLLSAFDGSILVNKTFSLADFHTEYTLARHQSYMTGVNLVTAYSSIRDIMRNELRNETAANYVGGNSSVLLFLLNAGNIDTNNVWEHARVINETVPDLRVLYATASNQMDNLWALVRDMHEDIFTISLSSAGTNVHTTMYPVFERIQTVGRRVINPNCGPNFDGESSGTRQFDDFVEPAYTNYYRISPNYFYSSNSNRKVRITRSAAGTGSLTICESRYVSLPRQNASSGESSINCQTLATTGNIEIGLQDPCNGFSTIGSCPPLFFSVQATPVSTTSSAVCTDLNQCRFPYSIRYQVQVEELGCFSSAASITASGVFLLLSVILNLSRSSN